jgi:hypothetical protein
MLGMFQKTNDGAPYLARLVLKVCDHFVQGLLQVLTYDAVVDPVKFNRYSVRPRGLVSHPLPAQLGPPLSLAHKGVCHRDVEEAFARLVP